MSIFVTLQRALPKVALTMVAGRLAEIEWAPSKNVFIRIFRRVYDVDLAEAKKKTPDEFVSFNDFFTRELDEGARPIDTDANRLLSPADGVVSECGRLQGDKLLQAKGVFYSVSELLANEDFAASMEQGSFATIYLSPRDYHRVHVPYGGELQEISYVPGKLFSVNDTTARSVDGLFARNERIVARFQTPGFSYALVMVGALIVGGMETVATGRIRRAKECTSLTIQGKREFNSGDEFGRFYLGSTAIVVVPESANLVLDPDVAAGLSVKMGESIASVE